MLKSFYKNKFFLIIILTLVAFLFFEIISRVIISVSVKNLDLFKIKRNPELEILDLTNFKFRTHIYGKHNQYEITNKKLIWSLGGSTTKGKACKNDIWEMKKLGNTKYILNDLYNWTEILGYKKKIYIKNLGENGATSNRSYKILSSNLKKTQKFNNQQLPHTIFWSNKINEHNIIYFSLDWKRNFNFRNIFLKKIFQVHYTLKENSIFYQLFIYTNEKIGKKILKKVKTPKPKFNLNNDELKRMIKFYNENTIKAYEIAKSYGVKKFIILIQPESRMLIFKSENEFDKMFKDNLKILKKNFDIDYVDLNKIKIQNLKNRDNYKLDNFYFCDEVHKKHYLHIEVANYLSKVDDLF